MSNYSDSSFSTENANTAWYKAFKLIQPKTKVLDIGCSSGNFGYELITRLGCVVDGIELNKKDATIANKKLRNVYQLNIESDDLSIIKQEYDVLYFGDVIEHLVDPVKAIARMKHFLNKDGRIIFSIPNMGFIGIRLDLLDGNFDYTETGILDKTHLHFYTLDEIKRVFSEAGFSISKLDYVKKDYPKKVIDKELKRNGLSAKASFYKQAAKIESSAFQFVGVATPEKVHNKHKIDRQQFGPVDLFETYFNDTITNHNIEISKLKTTIAELHQKVEYMNEKPIRNAIKTIRKKISR